MEEFKFFNTTPKNEMKKANFSVTVDAQVFLRIAKHAKQTFPASAAGSLLGLDTQREVRVTNCFAYKDKEENADFTDFQYEVLRTLGEVRIDANAVGWYESTHHGNFLNETLIESQYQFQKEVPSAVCIIYDPFQQKIGKCGFAAYRLTEEAMRRKETDEEDPFTNFPSEQLLEEVPITIHCSPLIETLLLQWQRPSFESLDMDQSSPALERNVQLLLESLDEFGMQQRELQMYEKQSRAAKEKQAKSSRIPKSIDTLNLSMQVLEHCRTIDTAARDSLGKLFMVSEKPELKNALKSLNQVPN